MTSNISAFPFNNPNAGKPGGTNGGDGGGDNVLAPRVARLESHVEHILRDTTDIKQKLERVADGVNDLKVSMASLAGRQDAFDIKLDSMDKKLELKLDAMDKSFESKLDAMGNHFELKLDALEKKFDSKFDGLDKKFATKADLHEALGKQQQWMFRTMLGLISTGVVLTGAIVAALFKYMPH